MITLRTIGGIDYTSWRAIWNRATTITSMCIKRAQNGIWMEIGNFYDYIDWVSVY